MEKYSNMSNVSVVVSARMGNDGPSVDEMQRYLEEWNHNDKYTTVDEVLKHMFTRAYPRNSTMNEVLPKVVMLNRLYFAGVLSVYEMAEHIVQLRIDKHLREGDISVVNRIARHDVDRKTINNYSFATKYCSFCNPDNFPIFDSRVEFVLWKYRNEIGCRFKKKELRDYRKFKEVMDAFIDRYKLNQGQAHIYKLIDQYLWQLGADLKDSHS